jgi:predicted enzyme related to lactoylglutathione lyase
MKNFITYVEIPVSDFNRAKDFYQKLLDIEIDEMDMGGILSGFFPSDGSNVSAAIIKTDDYIPSATATTVYLNSGDDLQPLLDKAKSLGATVSLPKTEIGPEMGFYAFFTDPEGNRIGLMSQS